jgi:hypothetical protein
MHVRSYFPCQIYTHISFDSGVETLPGGTVRIVRLSSDREAEEQHHTRYQPTSTNINQHSTEINARRAKNGVLNSPSTFRNERGSIDNEMSFGASPSDVIDVVAFCRALHRRCKDAGAEYDEVRDEVRGMQSSRNKLFLLCHVVA